MENTDKKIRKTSLILCSVVLICITVLYGEYLANQEQQNIIEKKQSKILPFAAKFEMQVSDIMTLLQITAKEKGVINTQYVDQIDPKIHGINELQDSEKREIARLVLANNNNLDAVYFTLPNGDMYLVEPYKYQLDLAVSNFAFRDWYRGVISTRAIYVSEIFSPTGKKDITVAITTPVRSESGDMVGIWGALLNLSSMSNKFNNDDLRKDEHIFLVDHNGNKIIDSKYSSFNTIDSYTYLKGIQSALEGNLGYIVETFNGRSSLVVYAPLKVGTHTWAVVDTEPYNDAFSSVRFIRLEYTAIAISMSSTLVVALYLLRGTRTITPWWIFSQRIKRIEENDAASQELRLSIKKRSRNLLIVIIAIAATSILVISLVQIHQTDNQTIGLKGTYLIQNLRGDTVDTWINWKIAEGTPFHIHVLNSPDVTPHRMAIIHDAIYSDEMAIIDDSLVHKAPPGTTSTYYKGWLGALQSINQQTKFPIPIHFHTIVTDAGEGNIVIKLSQLENGDGYSAYTKSYVDEENHQILKSVITIYNIDKLSDDQLATIVRHELGHAFGLAHSTAPEDLMAPVITTPYPYISECDVKAITGLYNGNQNSKVVCEK